MTPASAKLFTGSAKADNLHGSSRADRLNGNAGNDRLFGEGGHDRIFGQGGNDRLAGGTGNDDLSGGPGNDYLRGDLGRDRIDCGGGRDRVLADDSDRVSRDCEFVRLVEVDPPPAPAPGLSPAPEPPAAPPVPTQTPNPPPTTSPPTPAPSTPSPPPAAPAPRDPNAITGELLTSRNGLWAEEDFDGDGLCYLYQYVQDGGSVRGQRSVYFVNPATGECRWSLTPRQGGGFVLAAAGSEIVHQFVTGTRETLTDARYVPATDAIIATRPNGHDVALVGCGSVSFPAAFANAGLGC